METYALIFLITVGLLYAAQIRLVSALRYKEIEEWYGLDGYYPDDTEVEDKQYIPILSISILAVVIVAGWGIILKDPYQPLRDLTPSYSTSSWIWTTGAAFLACIPIGLALGSFFSVTEVKPESEWMYLAVIVTNIASVVFLALILCKVYSPWLVWFPIGSMMTLGLAIKKWLPGELDAKGESGGSASVTTSSSSYGGSGYDRGYSQPRSESRPTTSSSSSRSESECDRLAREAKADEYYYQYQQYRDEAERLLSDAESYDRSAEDNEYWARESNDSFKESEARRDRERANRLRYQSREAQRKADRYYGLYQQCRR